MRFGVDPDQLVLATGDKTGCVHVWRLDGDEEWDVHASAKLSHPRGAGQPVRMVCVGRGARTIMSCNDDGMVWRWKATAAGGGAG